MKLEFIVKYADELVERFKPFCKRIEKAGSIRRKQNIPACMNDEIKDIEIVCVPDSYKLAQHFLETSRSNPHEYTFLKRGPSYQKFKFKGQTVDMFTPTLENFGWLYYLRTGPKDWNTRTLMRLKKNGVISKGGKLRNIDTLEVIPTTEEQDIFDLLKVGFVEPERRQ